MMRRAPHHASDFDWPSDIPVSVTKWSEAVVWHPDGRCDSDQKVPRFFTLADLRVTDKTLTNRIKQAKAAQQAMTASTMSRTSVLLALLVIASLHMSVISAFSIAPPFGISLASLVTRRGRHIQPNADGDVASIPAGSPATGGPGAAAFIGRNPSPKVVEPTLLEFNMMCQQAIADERRKHYYPIVREISEHAR
jgi:hypothetical protein